MRMDNNYGEPRRVTGAFNIHRRKCDAQTWMKFEEMAVRERVSRSELLARIVRLWLDKNYVMPGPHNVNPPDNT